MVHYGEAQSWTHPILSGVLQGSVQEPLFHILYTADLPIISGIMTATFADDTAILATSVNNNMVVNTIQRGMDRIDDWARMWKIKTNCTKSIRVDFTLRSY